MFPELDYRWNRIIIRVIRRYLLNIVTLVDVTGSTYRVFSIGLPHARNKTGTALCFLYNVRENKALIYSIRSRKNMLKSKGGTYMRVLWAFRKAPCVGIVDRGMLLPYPSSVSIATFGSEY
jgi:hypothetical protein